MDKVLKDWLMHGKRRPKILVADDQPTNIRVLNELFSIECDLFMAATGEQALKVARAEQPDLILLDVMMDDIDGHEVCRRLKADALTNAIPVIFVTAQREEADELRGLDAGAVDFISKPVNPVIVRARVRTHLTLKLRTDLLRANALVDGLTGVGNRRRFEQDLDADWRQCLRESEPMSIALLDIDFFKQYNDCYGHLAGDECLQKVASAIQEALRRPYDIVFRYGGEEFACLLPKTDFKGAIAVAEQIRAYVERLEIPHPQSAASSVVTVSIGVASCVPLRDTNPHRLLHEADKQLYVAKRSGRARVSAIEA